MVRKANNKWHMYVDFTYLNATCYKDLYLLLNIDLLIDWYSGYRVPSFMDSYSRYNQINMDPLDAPKTTFTLNDGNYYYNVMPFGLKNASATYQRLINAVFSHQIGRNLEVYVDDTIIKIEEGHSHTENLEDILQSVRR